MAREEAARRHRLALLGATAALFVVHLVLTAMVEGPTVVFDENGYLGNARALAGGFGRWEMPFAPFYASGYSVLLVPLLEVFADPDSQWRAVQVLNAALLAAVLPLVFAVLRRVFDVPPRRALGAAAVASIVPAALAAGPSAVAENLVLPSVLALVLAAWAFADADGGRRISRWWFGPTAGLLYAAHPRFTVAVVLCAAVLAWWAWRHRGDLVVVLINLVGLIAVTGGAWTLNRWLRAERWVAGVEKLEGGPSSWFELLTSVQGAKEFALTAIGQAWYLAVGTLGLVVVALLSLMDTARRGSSLAGPDDGRTAPAPADVARRRLVVVVLVLLASGVFATSVLFFAQNQFRADHYVYGRHNDSFATLWVAIALAALMGRARHRVPWAMLGASVAVLAISGFIVATRRSPADLFEIFSPFAVPALARFADSRPSDVFIEGTLFGLGGAALITAAVVAIARRSEVGRSATVPQAILLATVAGWCAWAGFGAVRGTGKFAEAVYLNWTPIETIERLDVDELCIDASAARARANLNYPWYLPQVDMVTYNARNGEQPSCEATIALLDDPDRLAAGDRVAAIDQGGFYPFWEAPEGLAMWVASGPLQDRLAEVGALLPAGFPAEIPESAQRGELSLVDPPDAPVTVASGDSVRLRVDLAHTGTGAPWPDFSSYRGPSRVRVLAEITPRDPGGIRGARSGGELASWMLPGDRAQVDVDVLAIDEVLAPLPEGTYDVQLVIAQEDHDWMVSGGDDARFTMDVVPARPKR
jgi:hypothetical protein